MARKHGLVGIITGDIINSRSTQPRQWLSILKKTLSAEGESPEAWEIYRGDSFQLQVKNPSAAFLTAIRIKANLKSVKYLDVRMAIGIGMKEFPASKITESNGEAFIYSGEKLESLQQEKQNLAIKSPWNEFDREMNLYFRFASIAMDNWSAGAANLIRILVDNPDITQTTLAKKLKITQSAVSGRQKRAYYQEIRDLEDLFRQKLEKLMHS